MTLLMTATMGACVAQKPRSGKSQSNVSGEPLSAGRATGAGAVEPACGGRQTWVVVPMRASHTLGYLFIFATSPI